MEKTKLWFASYNENYYGNESCFYAINDLLIANILEENSAAIIDELKICWEKVGDKLMKNYSDDALQFPPHSWSKLVFKVWGLKNIESYTKFPYLGAVLDRHPEITSCFLSKTLGQSIIKEHCGETNATIRIHLGLYVPEGDIEQCGMQVGNEKVGWKEGKTLAFLDAHRHSVWNKTTKDRYVLIVDIIRPEFSKWRRFVNVRVLINQVFYTVADKINAKKLYEMPSSLFTFIAVFSYLPLQLITYLNNRLGFIKI